MNNDTPQLTVDSTLLDAERVFSLTERLRAAHARIDESRLPADRRGRWQRRLITITEIAQSDLARAEENLRRFDLEFRQHTRRR